MPLPHAPVVLPWRRLFAAGLCAALAWWLGLTGVQAAEIRTVEILSITDFELQDDQGQWGPWSLPARWTAGEADVLHLRTRFELSTTPLSMWAIYAGRLPPDHDLRINGQRVSGLDLGTRAALPRSVVSHWSALPPSLLHAGVNEMTLDVAMHRFPGGISALTLGPEEALYPRYRITKLLQESSPHALNLAVVGLAFFALGVWWLRRSERVMGFFGVLMLIVSVRNLGYYASDGLLPAWLGSLIFFIVQCATAALLAAFAIVQTTPSPHRRPLRAVMLVLLAVVALGMVASGTDRMPYLRSWTYPLLILVHLTSAWRLWRQAEGLSARWRRGLVIGGAVLLVCGIHDYLFNAAYLPVDDMFWLPFATPLMMVTVAWLLLQRLVQGMALTERHGVELESRVQERTRDLQMANAAKTRFVAAASHDLRQPVAAIGLLTGLLREQVSIDGGTRRLLDRLGDAVAALERLLKGLLDLSRFDAGAVDVRPAVVPLQPLFDAVAAHEQEGAASKGLRLRWRGGHLAVHSDRVLLEQILRNLVNNAVRYTERGGVLVSARRVGATQVLLQVRDTGVGIAADRQQQVFEEFVQLDNPARESSRGLGLGLSLVRRGAELLGVPLALWSQPGRGSCFSLRLARVEVAAHPAPMLAPGPLRLAGRRLVVVEDDESVRESLRLRLEGWGAQVQAYAGVQPLRQALERGAMPQRPDLLVSDQRLPDGDSAMVAVSLATVHARVPVLVITGDTAPADLARLVAQGWPVLHKPFDGDALFAALLAAMRRDAAASV